MSTAMVGGIYLSPPDNRSPDPVRLVSGGTGQVINSLINCGGGFGSAGDVDGDLSCDIFVAPLGDQRTKHDGTTLDAFLH